MAFRLTAEEQIILRRASAALDVMLAKWRELGVPAHGRSGLLLAAYVEVCLKQRRMSLQEMTADIIDCLESLCAPPN